MIRRFAPLLLLAAIGALFWVGLGLRPAVVPSPLIGKPAPQFTLPLLEDTARSFSTADFAAGPTLVHVWATWCVVCRAEHPLLLEFSRRGLVRVVGYNYKDERAAALRWLEAAGDPYAFNLYDPAGRVALDWGVYGTPETFVVDRAGVIRFKHVGALTPAVIDGQLVPLLQSLKAAP